MRKRGELTSAEIIGIVLLLAGLAIILAFIYGFKDSVTADDDVCKLSVVGRATASGFIGGGQQAIPLKCTTKKICLTNSIFGGSCSQFTGEKDVQTVRLSGGPEQQVQQIESISAQTMYSCWNMMGRGRLDLFSTAAGSFGLDSSKPTCVICTRVAISDDATKDKNFKEQVLNKIDMNTYLSSNQVPGDSRTYLQAFTDAGVNSFPAASNNALSDKQPEVLSASQITRSNENEMAFVFVQVKVPEVTKIIEKQATWAGAFIGGAVAFSPKTAVSVASKVFTPAGLILTAVIGLADAGVVTLNHFESQDAAAAYCGDFTSADKAKTGCSIVQMMPYSFEDISKVCTSIQGNP